MSALRDFDELDLSPFEVDDSGIAETLEEHPLEMRIIFPDDEAEMMLRLEHECYWPTKSERGRVDPDGEVHCQCPDCDKWFAVERRRNIWGGLERGYIARCPNCWDPECHYGSADTALEAAQELFG